MSVSLGIHTISDFDIKEIAADPIKLEILYHREDFDESLLDARNPVEKEKLLAWKPKAEPEVFFVGNTFQSLTYLLTKEIEGNAGDFPLNFLMASHDPVGEIGWGPVNFYTSSEVTEISKALLSLDLSEIEGRFDADDFNMHKIYPGGKWTITDLPFVMQRLRDLIKFIAETNEKDFGFFLIMS